MGWLETRVLGGGSGVEARRNSVKKIIYLAEIIALGKQRGQTWPEDRNSSTSASEAYLPGMHSSISSQLS